VNKVASKAILRWNIEDSPGVPPEVKSRFRSAYPAYVTAEGDVVLTSQKYRDQIRNRQDCREKLTTMLRRAAAVRTPRVRTRPTMGSKIRRLEEKKRRSKKRAERRLEHD
jgi:ribosome-associated protein